MTYEPVIGLEIHVELNTKTKMFCGCLNDPNERHPNMNICPVCMAHPGTLPVINQEAVKKVIMAGLAIGGEIPEFSPEGQASGYSQFDRKNYFYPDLPKGYQISQYEHPLVSGGYLDIHTRTARIHELLIANRALRRIRIQRIHLEEDTGRLVHDTNLADQRRMNAELRGTDGDQRGNIQRESASSPREPALEMRESATLVDFNRAGVPLMELVTEPDLRTGEEVRAFGEELQRILRYIGASDADMEKGQMRVEVNISLREIADQRRINAELRGTDGDQRGNIQRESASSPREPALEMRESAPLGTKVEIKNINSFKYAADAVDYEIKRQIAVLERGEKVVQETRGWNEHKGESFSQRSKESAHDYRYFPEPDLPPLRISREMVEELRALLPELPAEKRRRFEREYALDPDIIEILVRDKALADYYEHVVSELDAHDRETLEEPRKDLKRLAGGYMTGDFLRLLKETRAPISDIRITPENFAEFVLLVAEDKISNIAAKQVLEEMFQTGEDPSDIVEQKGLWQISDTSDLEDICRHIVKENPAAVQDYKNGKAASLQFLTGQVMKESRGKANPKLVQEILQRIMNKAY